MVQEMSADQYPLTKDPSKKNTERVTQHKRVDTRAVKNMDTLSDGKNLVDSMPLRGALTQADMKHRLDSRGSMASSQAPTNLNSNWIETSKLEKTLRGLNMVNKATSIIDTFLVTIKEIVNNLIQ